MKARITKEFVKHIKPESKPFEVRDTDIKGFILRVQPSGIMTYVAQYGRGRRITVGQASILKLDKAKEKAREFLASAILGADPMKERRKARAFTFEAFVRDRYAAWITSHQKDPGETLRRLALFYPYLGSKKLSEIDGWNIERFRSARLKEVKPITVNHDLDVLRAALSRAMDWGLIDNHPMRKVKRSKVDSEAKIRYLTPEEDKRLQTALKAREDKRRKQRIDFNEWRRVRGFQVFPEHGHFTDHLKPIVQLALNTGMRRGELFSLTWESVNFAGRILTVAGSTAKSGRTRHIPLNDEAFEVLRVWRQQHPGGDLVFPADDGRKMDNINSSWRRLMGDAGIEKFRFHDLRHTFASRLVMVGVDLNTVRELLGHSDIKMTLRYAHLAPERLAAAVNKLGAAQR